MLTYNMTLRQMVNFEPKDIDMAMLPLDVTVYLKVSLISLSKEDNYNFLKYLFSDENISQYFKDYLKTVFYDFDGTETSQEKFITVLELYSMMNYASTSEYLKELLQFYTHEADVIIDLYTHDSRSYRLSNLDGVVKLEQMHVTPAEEKQEEEDDGQIHLKF